MAALSPRPTGVPQSTSSLPKELCTYCGERPYDVICACGDKFDFMCICFHVGHLDQEFDYAKSVTGEQLLYVEQMVEDNNCEDARTLVENWKRKRIQDITDIADEVLRHVQDREYACSDVTSLRTAYNALSEETHVVHDKLDAILALQRQIAEKCDQLRTLSDLVCNDTRLNDKLLSHLHPHVLRPATVQKETKSSVFPSQPINTDENESLVPSASSITCQIEPVLSSSNAEIAASTSMKSINVTSVAKTSLNPERSLTTSERIVEKTSRLTNSYCGKDTEKDNLPNDEMEAGYTLRIHRQSSITIPAGNDKFASTICCHDNQLLYNGYHQRSRQTRLTLIPDIAQPGRRQIIEWTPPAATISGGDDDWIQDIAYCSRLQGYLLLSRARLRLLRSNTYELEEFVQFPDCSMKRVTCDGTYIYLVCAAGSTSQHGDEIILMGYDREEKIHKTFRDLILIRNNHISGALIGQISDLAISTKGQAMLAYRFERGREVGMCIYNVTNDGRDWAPAKRIVLNECWMDHLPYTPRTKWYEELGVFIVVEYVTGHLLMLDETGQIKGECRFSHGQDCCEPPLNISVSENNWLCVRYESSINIYPLQETIS